MILFVLILTLFFIALILIPCVTVRVWWNWEEGDHEITAEISSLRGLFRYKYSLIGLQTGYDSGRPSLTWKYYKEDARGRILIREPKGASLEEMYNSLSRLVRMGRLLLQSRMFRESLRRFAVLRRLNWETRIGTEDAMDTALVSGLLWGLKGTALMPVGALIPWRDVKIRVEPCYTERTFQTTLSCYIDTNIFQALITWLTVRPVLKQVRQI